ncbi:hypothetical protein B0H17DRAFT_1047552 [Mycena rosella]|uniref:Glycosyltransferase family 64 protein n=1 Tax=Mycena rosella TaxID=1033263 RepID=A0AAD7DU69_MYCRO|nr:hypothetical protein B0H17DRAFT_1047552 [Mycena rosella]
MPLKRLGSLWALLPVSVALCAALLFDQNTLWFAFQAPNPTRSPESIANHEPDVTAVLLNWTRFANVIQIVTELCREPLDRVIKEVVVWNNAGNSRPLAYDDFSNCNCSHRLRIHNSPENLYFQARFMACSNASTPYCFIQDDDYLIQPEIIRSLRARIDTHDIFVIPPNEVLSSHLLSINSPSTNITFAFSWLGYGALILRATPISEEETKMADNYYSILRNRFPEIWTSDPTALFDGGAFTVGEEGVTRNRRHIAAAANYLDVIAANQSPGNDEWPYVFLASSPPEPRIDRSPCVRRSCVIESTIQSLPDLFTADTHKTAGEIFAREEQLSRMLTEQFMANYVNFPLSRAVDADRTSFFRSVWNAAKGETLLLDVFDRVQEMNWTHVEWLWLVDSSTAEALTSSTFSYSAISCAPASPEDGVSSSAVFECDISMEGINIDRARYFQLQLRKSKLSFSPWLIYETWLRGRET